MKKVAIFHPTDLLGHVPGGIDSFIKGILHHAPSDLHYVVYGATSQPGERPVGESYSLYSKAGHPSTFIPIVETQASSVRTRIPLVLRYMNALRRHVKHETLNDVDVLDFHRIEPVFLFRRYDKPKNVTLHADYSILRDKNSDIMWRYWPGAYEYLEKLAFRSINCVFVVRRSAVERYQESIPSMREKFRFIPTWMDSTLFTPCRSEEERLRLRDSLREDLGCAPNDTILVFVGRLDHQKDPVMLIRALDLVMKEHGNLHLVIVGDGRLRGRVEQMLSAKQLAKHVTLVGVKRGPEIADILRGSDLFVLSSAYEGMCIAVLEALATGLPVVSTQVGEIDLVVKSGINGQVSSSRSPEAFANAIRDSLLNLELMRGEPCIQAVSPFKPAEVLRTIFDNHRAQASMQ